MIEEHSKKKNYLKYLEDNHDASALPLVSIIVPHHNTEMNLLLRAIDSVYNNKYTNIELIIVDDGSKEDISSTIYKTYYTYQIKFLRQQNSGPGIARNTGVKEAKGKYIFFMDADDTITLAGLYYLVLYAEQKSLKMVSGKTAIVDETGLPINISMEYLFNDTFVQYSSKDMDRVFYSQMVHGKLLRKDIFTDDNIWFKAGLYEDSLWTMELYSKLDRFDFLNIVSNHWYKYQNRNTLSSTATFNNFKERYKVYNEIIKLCDKKTFFRKTNFFFVYEIPMYFRNYHNFKKNDKEEFFSSLYTLVTSKHSFLSLNAEIHFSELKEAIAVNNFKKFEKLIEIHFNQKSDNSSKCDNYIAFTHYQLMVSIVYALENKQPSRLYLNSGYVIFNSNLVKNLEKVGLFEKIIVFENKESTKLIEQLKKANEEAQYIIPTILYPPYQKIFSDIKEEENIYVFNSTLPYWYYIARTSKNIIKLEDGYNSIINELNQLSKHGVYFELLEKHTPNIYPSSVLFVSKKIIISKESDELLDELKRKVLVLDTKELIEKNIYEYNKILKNIYFAEEKGSKNGCLILTQPLDKILYCTSEEKSRLYRKMISEYKNHNPIYIKPHPADNYPYSTWWGVKVLDKDIPIEVYAIQGFKCKTVVTFGSTAIQNIDIADTYITLYQDDNVSREKVTLKIKKYIKGYRDIYDSNIYRYVQKIKNLSYRIKNSYKINKIKKKVFTLIKKLYMNLKL